MNGLQTIQVATGRGVILLGLFGVIFGIYAVLRLRSFYARMVVTSKVEAMGFTAIVLGAIILAGLSLWSIKLAFILVFELLTVAVSSHAIARSAWQNGYHLPPHKKENQHD